MELRLLKMFVAISKTGMLSSAAQEMGITPSAISHGLKILETELGCRLFDRVGRSVKMNQAGEHFLSQIEPVLLKLDTSIESLKDLNKWGEKILRIGAGSTFCQYILPRVLREFKIKFPEASVQVESFDTPDLIKGLRANRFDLGIGLIPEESDGIDIRPLFKDELLLTLSRSHPLASLRHVLKDQISQYPFILYQRNSVTSEIIEKYFQKNSIRIRKTIEVSSVEAIKEFVKLNLGICVLAPWTVSKELERRTLIMKPLGPLPIRRNWVMMNRKGCRSNLMEIVFYKLCKQFVTSVRTDRDDIPQR